MPPFRNATRNTPIVAGLRYLAPIALFAAAVVWQPEIAAAEDASTKFAVDVSASADRQSPKELAIDELHKQLRAITAGATLKRGTTAVYVVDADSGRELYEVHGDAPLNPASNVKLVSTGTVLATLGPNWRYQTRILGDSPDAEGVVHGGLYLYGNSDPTLGGGALTSLAGKLRARGVTRIAGDVHLSDHPVRDGLASSRVRVTVVGGAPGKAPQVEVWPRSELVQVESVKVRSRKRGRSRVSVRSRVVHAEGQPAVVKLQVRGTIRTGHKRVRYARVPSRPLLTGSALKTALIEAGIAVDGEVSLQSFSAFNEASSRAGRLPFPLVTHKSATISSLVARVNKRSLNNLSDRLVMTAAQSVHGGDLSMDNAVTLMKSWLSSIGVDPDNVVLDSGSGLSYQTKLTTRQIVKVLRAAGGYENQLVEPSAVESFRNSLAIGGTDGTLRSRFRTEGHTLVGQVHGKTGTLTSVIALSGFLEGADGRTLCFSIVTNGHRNQRKRNVRLSHENVVTRLDRFLDTTSGSSDAAARVADSEVSATPALGATTPDTDTPGAMQP